MNTNITTPTDAFVEAIADRVIQKLLPLLSANCSNGSKKLMDIKSAAAYLSRSQSTVRHMISTGEIPACLLKRFGRRVFLVKDELDKWVNAQ